jgi:hypothetical protein
MAHESAPSLHQLIGDALDRAARLKEESRTAVESIRTSSAALQRTVATVQRGREARAAGQRDRHA